jgi:hypothetical protein
VEGVALSREELYAILRLIKAPSLPGFDTSWARMGADGEPTTETREALRMGTDALIARGYLTLAPPPHPNEEPHLEVPAPVVALVGACAFSDFSVRFAGVADGVFQQFYIHQLAALGALHTTPQPGVHLFMPLAGRKGLLTAIATLVGVDVAVASGGQLGVIALDAMRQAVNVARTGDGEGVRRALRQAAVNSEGTLRGLEDALARNPVWGELSVAVRGEHGAVIERDIFTLAAPGASFMFSPQPEDPGQLGIFMGAVNRITDWVAAQLPPADVRHGASG